MSEPLRSLLSLSDDGFVAFDPDGRVVEMNARASRLLSKGEGVDLSIIDGLETALASRHRVELTWRPPGQSTILVSIRPGPDGTLVTLRDLVGHDDVRARTAIQNSEIGSGHLSVHRARPDFALQRRLSPALHRVLSRGERAIRQGARVVVTGESGVGKSEIARFLHATVADGRDPFVVCNCAMSSASDLSTALFGSQDAAGLSAMAAGGTLFLDEIAEIPLSVQAQLLGYLEDGRQPWPAEGARGLAQPRIVAATGSDLQRLVNEGRFRADLYYRLAVIELAVPPLRRMPELIGHLTDRFLKIVNMRRTSPVVLPHRFRDILLDYAFPGNIRELLNIVQKAAVFTEDAADMEELVAELIRPNPAPSDADLPDAATLDLKSEVRRFERALIDKAIRIHGSKRKAATALGVDIGTIVRKTA